MPLPPFPRHIRWPALFFSFAFLLAPLIVGFGNFGSKVSGDAAPADRPVYTGQLPDVVQ